MFHFILKVLQGSLVGLGAVLPGISGGVLCVIFGIYKTIMEFLASPFKRLKSHFPKLLPYGIGFIIGFLGISKLLAFLLEKHPAPSVCVFIGLIVGMMPSLFKEAKRKGTTKASYVSMIVGAVIIFALLTGLKFLKVTIAPNFGWFIFCGFCLALSLIAPGMSFSTLLMPLGLYTPFVDGIGDLNFSILIPGGIGALATIILLSKAINTLFERHYSVSFHAIIGIVIAATIMIIPFASFTVSITSCVVNVICLACGVITATVLDKINTKIISKNKD